MHKGTLMLRGGTGVSLFVTQAYEAQGIGAL